VLEIHNMRFSFIWTDTVLDLLAAPLPPNAPLAFLGRRSTYAEQFEAVQGGAQAKDIQLPWLEAGRQFFWLYYLERRTLTDLGGDQAWKALVPLRGKVPITVHTAWTPSPLVLEAFYYPYGLVFILTVRCREHLTLEQAVEKAFELRRGREFHTTWGDTGASEDFSLDGLGDKVLTVLRKGAFGPHASASAQSVKPFSVVTIVKGAGVDPGQPTPDGGEIHRALEAMTSWQPTWKYDTLPPLADVSLHIRRSPVSHLLYGHDRGRVVWFPGLFIPRARGLHSLACYHRNLVLASMQVESLGGLLSETARQIQAGTPLSATHKECAKRAAVMMGLLYAGHSSTYRSWSPRVQIEHNNLVADVNQVRQDFSLPLLH
jgi:hypothetical protein